MKEDELIRKLATDKDSAFKELVDTYQGLVLSTARGFVKNDDDARDLSQEVFIKIFQSLDQFRGESGLSTWIYRITVNRSMNYLRDQKKHRNTQSLDVQFNDSDAPDPGRRLSSSNQDSPEKELENKDKARFLHMALDSLPENQRKAFVLSKYDDLSYKEISEVLEMSISSVESLLFRARKNLQKKLWECYKKIC